MTSKAQFEALATEIGSDAISEEQAILNIGREFLPPCAIVVLDGGEPTDEYWEFLASQTRQAQAEHDAIARYWFHAEYASGHEWHE